jgi:hypothetical protein
MSWLTPNFFPKKSWFYKFEFGSPVVERIKGKSLLLVEKEQKLIEE